MIQHYRETNLIDFTLHHGATANVEVGKTFAAVLWTANTNTDCGNEASRWDEYKIVKARWSIKTFTAPMTSLDAVTDQGAVNDPAGEPLIAYIKDYDDSTLPTTVSYILQRGGRLTRLGRGAGVTFVPHPEDTALAHTTGTTGKGIRYRNPWIPSTDKTVEHRGIKYGICMPLRPAGGNVEYNQSVLAYQTLEYWVAFRKKLPQTDSGNF